EDARAAVGERVGNAEEVVDDAEELVESEESVREDDRILGLRVRAIEEAESSRRAGYARAERHDDQEDGQRADETRHTSPLRRRIGDGQSFGGPPTTEGGVEERGSRLSEAPGVAPAG